MTQGPGSIPRGLHGKILTTSLRFEAGTEVLLHCFTHTQFAEVKKSNHKTYRGLVTFLKPLPSIPILKTTELERMK